MLQSLRTPCDNTQNQFCNQNVHTIIFKMLEKYPDWISGAFERGLLDPPYHVFENEECVQYIQWYVPFHFPQIETAMRPVLIDLMRKQLFKVRPIRILDIGSGPATVPLAFLREFDRFSYPFKLNITTLEASDTFNVMIDVFNENKSNNNITISKRLHYGFDKFIEDAEDSEGRFDWIIISNFIHGIGSTVDDVENILKELFYDLMIVDQPLYYTFIETKSPLANNFWIEASFCTNNISEEVIHTLNCQKSFPKIMNCYFYNTGHRNHYKPYIITKTMRLMLT